MLPGHDLQVRPAQADHLGPDQYLAGPGGGRAALLQHDLAGPAHHQRRGAFSRS